MPPNEQLRLQRIIAIFSIGIIEALKDGRIAIREAELLLFSPNTMTWCEGINAEPELQDLVHIGTELDAVNDMLPKEDWVAAVNKIRANANSLLSRTTPSDPQLDHWIPQLIKALGGVG